ncbi:MAG: transcriptional regulator [Sediminicola sp.]
METPVKKELIEVLGLHFESLYQMPPLATRIYALLILTDSEGHTFEELMEATEASKSSVSTSINLLLQTEKIEYFTMPGDRKRHFRKNADYLKNRLTNYSQQAYKELKLFEMTCAFMKQSYLASYLKNEKLTTIYRDYLEALKQLMETTIHKLEKIS